MSTATLEPEAKRSLGETFRKVRKIMKRDPIAALRELEEKRLKIEAQFRGVLKRTGDYGRESEQARKTFFSQYTIAALEKYIHAAALAEPAHETEAFLGRQIAIGVCGDEFRRENPKFREALVAAAEFRLAQAQRGFDAALVKETKRLSGKDFDREQIEGSPEVGREKSQVERFTRLIQLAKTAPAEVVWQNCGQLLDND